MSRIITAIKLWQDGVFAPSGCTVNLNCELFAGRTPRNAWLKPEDGCCGGQPGVYGLTLKQPDPTKAGVLQGVWIDMLDGTGILIDAADISDVTDACNGCCGDTPVIAGRYNGTFPVIADLVPATYTFTRVDQGDGYSLQKVGLDYLHKIIPGSAVRTNWNASTNTSTYTFSAYYEPVFLGTDTKTGETSKTFDSNTPPTLGGGEVLNLTVYADGVAISPVLTGADLAALVTAATANANYNTKGTYSSVGGKLRLTTTVVNQATVVVGKQAS